VVALRVVQPSLTRCGQAISNNQASNMPLLSLKLLSLPRHAHVRAAGNPTCKELEGLHLTCDSDLQRRKLDPQADSLFFGGYAHVVCVS
jgi:hypothetical protein